MFRCEKYNTINNRFLGVLPKEASQVVVGDYIDGDEVIRRSWSFSNSVVLKLFVLSKEEDWRDD